VRRRIDFESAKPADIDFSGLSRLAEIAIRQNRGANIKSAALCHLKAAMSVPTKHAPLSKELYEELGSACRGPVYPRDEAG
jgi:hypothetical protein